MCQGAIDPSQQVSDVPDPSLQMQHVSIQELNWPNQFLLRNFVHLAKDQITKLTKPSPKLPINTAAEQCTVIELNFLETCNYLRLGSLR